jgi:hypothetical protein
MLNEENDNGSREFACKRLDYFLGDYRGASMFEA